MVHIDFLHGGNIYAVKREFAKDVIDFSANINPLGLPAKLKKAIHKNFDKVLHYPDPAAKEVTQKIAKFWRIDEQNVLVGNGSAELIYLIMATFRPRSTLIPVPTFSEYERAARFVKSKIRFIKLKKEEGFKFQDVKFDTADILFLCNPNNPTGNLILADYRIIDEFANKLVVVDEAFMDFLPDEERHTLIWRAWKFKKVIVLRTFTKFFALPGLRIGYLVAHKKIIQALRQNQVPWSVNALAQEAARLILDDKTYIDKTKAFIEKEREFLFEAIARIKGLIPYPSVTNFLLVRIKNKGLTSLLLTKRLMQRGILVRDCANFRGLDNSFLRIAVRSRKENLILLKALREIV